MATTFPVAFKHGWLTRSDAVAAQATGARLANRLIRAAHVLIALHLVSAALFFLEAGLGERLLWALAALAVTVASAYVYPRLSAARRGVLALAVGTPVLLAGAGIHGVHIMARGMTASDYTGVLMAVSGFVLFATGVTVLTRLIRSWWRRLFVIPVLLVTIVGVLIPVGGGIAVTNFPRLPICCEDTPATRGLAYEDVSFETPEGQTISGWYIPSQNRAAVIAVHGAGRGRNRTMDQSEVLAKHGYGVLMIDVEGYGKSEGHINLYGWAGARDVNAAVAYLKTRDDIDADKIGGLGLSMGGEIMLTAAGEGPGLRAIIVEGASMRTPDDFDELPGLDFKLSLPMQWMTAATVELLSGHDQPLPLKELVPQIAPRDVLLISADVFDERTLSREYAKLGGPSFQTWETPDSHHIGALELYPEEYEQRVIEFLDRALRPVPSS